MSAQACPVPIAAIKETIEQQIACAHTLIATLERERAALLGSHLQELEQACADKLASATRLQTLGVTLERLHATPGKIEQLIAQSDDAGITLARWRELLRLAAQCQQDNLANGALLDERQSQLRWTRRALHGGAPVSTYGRSGDSGYDFGRRSLASA